MKGFDLYEKPSYYICYKMSINNINYLWMRLEN